MELSLNDIKVMLADAMIERNYWQQVAVERQRQIEELKEQQEKSADGYNADG